MKRFKVCIIIEFECRLSSFLSRSFFDFFNFFLVPLSLEPLLIIGIPSARFNCYIIESRLGNNRTPLQRFLLMS
jgi:hypothetical protein